MAELMGPGKHGSTLGGNPICMSVARTIFDVIERDRLLEHAQAMGERAVSRLRNEPTIASKITDVRGRGLMLGIELKDAPDKESFVSKAMSRRIIANLTASKVIRLAPPINITQADWDRGLDAVVELIASL